MKASKPSAPPLFALISLLLIPFLTGCPRTAPEKPTFFVSVEPHAFLLDRIGGERIRVEVLVPAGVEPENYEATPQKMAALSRSRALFLTGMPFEETLTAKLASLAEDLSFVDLREGLTLRTLELHSHGDDEAAHVHHAGCSHDGLDPHIWFAPTILKHQAGTVLKTLVERDPVGEDLYRENYQRLCNEIDTTRQHIATLLEPHRGETVLVFHPSYGYFCDEFELRQRAIEFEGRSPTAQQLSSLTAEVVREDCRPIIFIQPEFNESPALAIAEATGARTVVHSSLRRDLLQSMLDFAEEIAGTDQKQGQTEK